MSVMTNFTASDMPGASVTPVVAVASKKTPKAAKKAPEPVTEVAEEAPVAEETTTETVAEEETVTEEV